MYALFPHTKLTPVDFGVIFGYFLLMVAVGLVCRRFSSNMSDYIRAGCRGTWWLVGVGIFMTGFSALTFTGIGGQAYIAGWSAMMIFWAGTVQYLIQAFFFAPILRQTRAVTSGDAVRARFGPVTEQIFTWLSPVIGLTWGSVVILGLSTFLGVFFGIPVPAIIVAVGVVVLFYSVIAGAWGALTSDFLQFLILLPTTLAVAFLALSEVGGIGGLFARIHALGLTGDYALLKSAGHLYQTQLKMSPGLFTKSWLLATLLGTVLAATNLSGCSRYLSVKTGREASKAALLAAGLVFCGATIWFIPPMVGRVLYAPEIEGLTGIGNPADAAYAIVSWKVLPSGMVGLVIVTMLAASMSVLDGILTGSAGLLVNNAFRAVSRKAGAPPWSPRKELLLTKATNLGLNVILISIALMMYRTAGSKGLYHIMINVALLVGAPITLPFAFALLVRRVPEWSALASMGAGFFTSAVLALGEAYGGWSVPWDIKTYWLWGVGAIAFFGTWLWRRTSPDAYYAKVDAFFTQIKTPIDFEKEVGQANDTTQLKVNGWFAMVVGAAILALLCFNRTPLGCGVVFGITGFIWSIGATLLIVARRNDAQAAAARVAEGEPVPLTESVPSP